MRLERATTGQMLGKAGINILSDADVDAAAGAVEEVEVPNSHTAGICPHSPRSVQTPDHQIAVVSCDRKQGGRRVGDDGRHRGFDMQRIDDLECRGIDQGDPACDSLVTYGQIAIIECVCHAADKAGLLIQPVQRRGHHCSGLRVPQSNGGSLRLRLVVINVSVQCTCCELGTVMTHCELHKHGRSVREP